MARYRQGTNLNGRIKGTFWVQFLKVESGARTTVAGGGDQLADSPPSSKSWLDIAPPARGEISAIITITIFFKSMLATKMQQIIKGFSPLLRPNLASFRPQDQVFSNGQFEL